ncbi:MAG TPA: hypothetical protein VM434_03925 [Beijerinckiaceae bacterium]|nr:hypothetical protein [Beijerinckiaceae bacterium]
MDIQRNPPGRVARVVVIDTEVAEDGWINVGPAAARAAEPMIEAAAVPAAGNTLPMVIEARAEPVAEAPARANLSRADLAAWVERLRAPTGAGDLPPPPPAREPPRRVPEADILVLPRRPAPPPPAGGSVVAFRAALRRPGSAPRVIGLFLLLLATIGAFALNLVNRGSAKGVVVPATLDEKARIT